MRNRASASVVLLTVLSAVILLCSTIKEPAFPHEDVAGHTVFLLGIFTTLTERTRRDDIRETYLKRQGDGVVCSLRAFLLNFSQRDLRHCVCVRIGWKPC